MSLLYSLYNLVLDALFPISSEERRLLALTPEQAYRELPHASNVSGDTYSVFAYTDEYVRKLIWNIKYKRSAHAIKIGGYALYQHVVARSDLATSVILIPMPITARRRRERGFNQCELLTDEIARLDTQHQFTIHTNLLLRTTHTARQTLKNRKDRLHDARGIFSVHEHAATYIQQGVTLLLIDDVITTGSTMKEALETLRRAGFANVHGVSLAH